MRGMFIRPEQIAAIARAMPALGRLRLRITRQDEQDVMELLAEGEGDVAGFIGAGELAIGGQNGAVRLNGIEVVAQH